MIRVRGWASFAFFAVILGAMPSGSGQVDLTPEPAPEMPPVFRDYMPRCARDGVSGMIERDSTHYGSMNRWGRIDDSRTTESDPWPIIHTYVRGLSGKNGTREWSYDVGNWNVVLPGVWAPVRSGEAWDVANPKPYYKAGPAAPDNVHLLTDVDGDGVCDLAAYGWKMVGWGGDGDLVVLSGANGSVLWKYPISWRAYDSICLPVGFTGYPTGMLAYDAPSGPRVVWKITHEASYTCEGSVFTDRVIVFDARTGERIWQRNVSISTPVWTTQYLTGLGDMEGLGEPSIILDLTPNRFCISPGGLDAVADNLPIPEDLKDIINGLLRSTPLWPSVRALGGTNGTVLWGPTSAFVLPQGGLSLDEEALQCLITGNAKVVDDIDDDGRADVVVTYLIQERNDPTTTNGQFLTTVVPVSGGNGSLLWPGRPIRFQGWGFVSDLNTPFGSSQPFVGVGLVDVPTETAQGARPPPKSVRIMSLRVSDGSPAWGNRLHPLALDGRFSYDQALNQFKTNLAPQDFDEDGVRDFLMPAHYADPGVDHQTVLSIATHTYDVVSGRTGKVLKTLEAFGPVGQALPCPGQGADEILVVSGHVRRLDLTAQLASDRSEVWRHAIWVDRRPQAQLSAINVEFLGSRCQVVENGRTFFGFDLGVYSDRRGEEHRGLHGFVDATGAIEWILPNIASGAPNAASLSTFGSQPKGPPVWMRLSISTTFLGLGIASAFGLVRLVGRGRNQDSEGPGQARPGGPL